MVNHIPNCRAVLESISIVSAECNEFDTTLVGVDGLLCDRVQYEGDPRFPLAILADGEQPIKVLSPIL